MRRSATHAHYPLAGRRTLPDVLHHRARRADDEYDGRGRGRLLGRHSSKAVGRARLLQLNCCLEATARPGPSRAVVVSRRPGLGGLLFAACSASSSQHWAMSISLEEQLATWWDYPTAALRRLSTIGHVATRCPVR